MTPQRWALLSAALIALLRVGMVCFVGYTCFDLYKLGVHTWRWSWDSSPCRLHLQGYHNAPTLTVVYCER